MTAISDPIAAPPGAPPSASPQVSPGASPWLRSMLATPAAKLVLILFLMLVMQIPLEMVDGVVTERQSRQQEVLAQFRTSWGAAQTIAGPILVVPFDVPADPAARRAHRQGAIQVAPARLVVAATLAPQTRRRGFFTATVYTADIRIEGNFSVPALAAPNEAGAVLLWRDAFLLLAATDLRGAPADAAITVDGHAIRFEPAPEPVYCQGMQAVIARLPLDGPPSADTKMNFSHHVGLRGTESFRVAPIARQTDLTISAPWPTPSFVGEVPPLNYTVTDSDFTASWQVVSNGVENRSVWTSESGSGCNNGSAAILASDAQPGVQLLEAVPTYRMVVRAAKYANLFLVLAFLTYFLFETVSGLRIHLVQYGLLGLSISLFALLLVSFGEPLGFALAYAISSALVMGQATLFTRSVVGHAAPSLIFAGVLASLFGFLYVVLSLETYSLLVGTVAVFAALSVVMAATRQIRWSAA